MSLYIPASHVSDLALLDISRSTIYHNRTEMFSLLLRTQPPKLPQRPLRLPHVVAAHERHQSTLIMKAMMGRAVYAQTAEGYTPAWNELVGAGRDGTRDRGIWKVRRLMRRALSAIRGSGHSSTITYPGSSKRTSLPHYAKQSSLLGANSDSSLGSNREDLIRRALENGPRRVRFYEGNPVWFYDEDEPVRLSDENEPVRLGDENKPTQLVDENRPVRSYNEQTEVRFYELQPRIDSRHQTVAELSPRSVVAAGWTGAARGHDRAGSVTPPEVAHVY
ncbi:hypothetical protein FRC11_015004 [Ceratobasidium sp. 423]|nr:hypothetical protein FRC11_015004 [Ceratobasidium sp. 423]